MMLASWCSVPRLVPQLSPGASPTVRPSRPIPREVSDVGLYFVSPGFSVVYLRGPGRVPWTCGRSASVWNPVASASPVVRRFDPWCLAFSSILGSAVLLGGVSMPDLKMVLSSVRGQLQLVGRRREELDRERGSRPGARSACCRC